MYLEDLDDNNIIYMKYYNYIFKLILYDEY